jgi:hypothetical protein
MACPRGDDLMRQADKRQGTGFFAELVQSGDKWDAIVELLGKAAVQYKLAHEWQRAAQAHERASKLELDKLHDAHSACSSLQNAARAYQQQQTDLPAAVRCFTACAELHMEQGHFGQAGASWAECAAVQEKLATPASLAAAIASYERAANSYNADTTTSNRSRSSGVRVKMAKLHLSNKAYDKAAIIYERLAQDAARESDSAAARWNLASYMYEGLLCHMAAGNINLPAFEAQIDHAGDACPHFADSREQKFVRALCAALAEGDEAAFADAVAAHDTISPMDRAHVELLLAIKRTIGHAALEDDQVGV